MCFQLHNKKKQAQTPYGVQKSQHGLWALFVLIIHLLEPAPKALYLPLLLLHLAKELASCAMYTIYRSRFFNLSRKGPFDIAPFVKKLCPIRSNKQTCEGPDQHIHITVTEKVNVIEHIGESTSMFVILLGKTGMPTFY
jgi:hypothetical protein